MLTDSQRLLIAASVDDSVPPEQASALARLLAGSAKARALMAKLADDRRRLTELPLQTAPFGFADRVDADLPIIRLPQPVPVPRKAAWLPYITAAGLFVAVGAVAYQFTGRPKEPTKEVASAPTVAPRPPSPRIKPTELAPTPRPADESPAVVTQTAPPPNEIAPAPRAVGAPALFAAGLFREIESPAEVTARLPLLGTVGELDSADARSRMAATWATLTAARIDLFVPDPAAALPAVQAAGKRCGWVVATDAATQSLLNHKQPGTFALYLDGVPADEAGKFLAGLAAQQRDGAKLGLAHLSAAGATDLRELKELLGGEPKPVARSPRDDSTIGQVVKQLPTRRPALLYATSPPAARPTPTSKEVRGFADGRGETKPGGIPLLVVIRPAG